MTIEAVIVGAHLPEGVKLGDRFEISGMAQVIGVSEELVDVRCWGRRDPDYAPGDRGVRVLISTTNLGPITSRPS